MATSIALLKGINVRGHKKVPMAHLRQLLTKEGFHNVQSYIQSGNVVFESSEKSDILEEKIQKIILSHFRFEVSIIVKTNHELQTIFDVCPFSNGKIEKSYFIILNQIPDRSLIEEVSKINYENEDFVIKNDCLYFYNGAGYGQVKFNLNLF